MDDQRTVFYGELQYILDCVLSPHPSLPITQPTRFLLALVSEAGTNGQDATLETVSYNQMTYGMKFIDLRAIGSVIGRLKLKTNGPGSRDTWGIIDRSGDYARTEFTDDALAGRDGEDQMEEGDIEVA